MVKVQENGLEDKSDPSGKSVQKDPMENKKCLVLHMQQVPLVSTSLLEA